MSVIVIGIIDNKNKRNEEKAKNCSKLPLLFFFHSNALPPNY